MQTAIAQIPAPASPAGPKSCAYVRISQRLVLGGAVGVTRRSARGQSPGVGPACRLDIQGGMMHFPGAAAQTGRRRKIALPQDTPRSQAGHAKGYTSHTHTHLSNPLPNGMPPCHSRKGAVYSGIAALTIAMPVDSPSQTKREGEVKAFLAE